MNNPSKIAELQELEGWRTKFDVAGAATEGFFSKRWIAERLFGMSDEEFVRNQREMFYDRKFEAALEAEVEAGLEEAGGMAGELGGPMEELGAEEELAGEELGAEEELAGEEAVGEEEEVLLAEPGAIAGKRDAYTKRKWKGKWYKPVETDKRDMGARKRSIIQKSGRKEGGQRGTFPGYGELVTLSKGISESEETNYKHQEELLLETNYEVRNLINELEQRQDEAKTQ